MVEDIARGVSFYLGRDPQPGDPIFPSIRYTSNGRGDAQGAFCRPASAKKIRQALAALNLPTTGAKARSITMHAARRSFISYLERAKIPELDRKQLIGHGIADVTHRHYTNEDVDRLRELAASVAKIELTWTDPQPPPSRIQ